jgi:hypothetical protein
VDAGGEFYDEDFFKTLTSSQARALLIGRRALVALGAPVMTSDYDVWLHIDDIELLNAAFAQLHHFPNHPPDVARQRGRYVLENGQHIDVMVARAKSDQAACSLTFDEAWSARQTLVIEGSLTAYLPSIDHLIVTKRWASRPRDLVDIEWLSIFRANQT